MTRCRVVHRDRQARGVAVRDAAADGSDNYSLVRPQLAHQLVKPSAAPVIRDCSAPLMRVQRVVPRRAGSAVRR